MTIDGKDDKVTTSKGETNNEEDADLITSGKGINLYNRSKENIKKNQNRDGTEAGGNTTSQEKVREIEDEDEGGSDDKAKVNGDVSNNDKSGAGGDTGLINRTKKNDSGEENLSGGESNRE